MQLAEPSWVDMDRLEAGLLVWNTSWINKNLGLHLQKSRTIESGEGFLSAFVDLANPSCESVNHPIDIIFTKPLDDDTLLRFYKLNATHNGSSKQLEHLFVSHWSNPHQQQFYQQVFLDIRHREGTLIILQYTRNSAFGKHKNPSESQASVVALVRMSGPPKQSILACGRIWKTILDMKEVHSMMARQMQFGIYVKFKRPYWTIRTKRVSCSQKKTCWRWVGWMMPATFWQKDRDPAHCVQ